MKNNKGFTMVELIAVITILALIALITVPTVNKVIDNSKRKAYDKQVDTIVKAAKTMMAQDGSVYMTKIEDDFYIVDVNTLVINGYIEEVINPITEESMGDSCVFIDDVTGEGNFEYEFSLECERNDYAYPLPR